MCGIHASISTRGFQTPCRDLEHMLWNRGPDHIGRTQARIDNKNGISYWISLTSTVLALRGGQITAQPFVDSSAGSALCWNGEAWKIGSGPVVGNDGQAVFESLIRASSAQTTASQSVLAIIEVLKSISGPFAFVFLDKHHDQIYFGRDRLGRRSLVYNNDSDSVSLEFASTADPAGGIWKEVEADGIYVLPFSVEETMDELQEREEPADRLLSTSILPVSRHAWESTGVEASLGPSLGIFNRELPTENYILNAQTTSVKVLRNQLCESLKLRILNVPVPPGLTQKHNARVAVLFSGGLDCTVLARMAHDILPLDQHIDLINVAFENPRVVQAAKNAAKSKKHSVKEDEGTSILTDTQEAATNKDSLAELSPFESCPDRETGRKAFEELQNVCPDRTWRFIEADVPYTETIAHRTNVVKLIHPHNTEMDLSIAYALYFAARGVGIASANGDPAPVPYSTTARVLLSGLGADELFGGYTRHATAFSRKGFPGLLDELELDVNRLGKRNLGRDDRVISHWGREARFPYLDESLVNWAVECPIWEKCGWPTNVSEDHEIPEIEPGKKVLRLLAYELGMHSVAQEKKRAIQFGARTAKMEIGRTKGTMLIS